MTIETNNPTVIQYPLTTTTRISIPTTTKRFIAYFDIMGFKDFTMKNSHEEVSKRMAFIREILANVEKYHIEETDRAVIPVIFSDTILFVSKTDDNDCFNTFITTVSYVLLFLLNNDIPVKGAIAHGTLTIDRENSLYFGQPLIDAYLLADEVFFYGLVIHHTAEVLIKSFSDKSKATYHITTAEVPMKDGNISHGYVDISRLVRLSENKEKGTIDKFNDAIDRHYNTVSGKIRKYVDNTARIYKR